MNRLFLALLVGLAVLAAPQFVQAHLKKRPGNTPKPHAIKHKCVDIQAGPRHPNLHRNK